MRELHIFDPESDMALAHGGDSYNAPSWTLRFRRDLEMLPAFIAPAGSLVLAEDCAAQQWIDRMGLDIEIIGHEQLRKLDDVKIVPWGWSPALCKELMLSGMSPTLLPDAQQLKLIRQLSHRRTSIVVHRRLSQLLGREFSPVPCECSSTAQVIEFARQHHGCYIKTPWSGSGRGIYRNLDGSITPELARWVDGAIGRQGSVLCEVALDGTFDFAVEFHCSAERGVVVAGYSVFGCDSHNQYGTGMVDSPENMHTYIIERCPCIDRVTEALVQIIAEEIAPHYNGYLGIDMLTYRKADGTVGLDPCVEVNLRATMGVVVARLGERGMRGQFAIVPATQATGTLLTPVHNDTRHTAVVTK